MLLQPKAVAVNSIVIDAAQQILIVEAATTGIHATVTGQDTVEEAAASQTCASTLGKPEAFPSFSTYIMLDVVGRIPAP